MSEFVTRSAKRAYEERKIGMGKGIDELLFPILDEDTAAAFRLDRYISNPYGISYRNTDNQSVIRHFQAGTTELVTVPRASEKTPIDEELEDQLAVGVEASEGGMVSVMKNTDQIIGDHIEGHKMTKWFQALSVIGEDLFPAKGVEGGDLGLNYEHGRDSGNELTYDFTATGATFDEALGEISDLLNTKNAPQGERFVILGSDWRNAFSTDTTLLERASANSDNSLLAQQRFAQRFGEVEGLYVLGQYRAPGCTAPFWILDFTPGTEYVPYSGATSQPFVPATACYFGTLQSRRFRINRGVVALNDNGQKQRLVADMVVDTFQTDDPVTTFIRSQTRHIHIAGNINQTGKSTGTFE